MIPRSTHSSLQPLRRKFFSRRLRLTARYTSWAADLRKGKTSTSAVALHGSSAGMTKRRPSKIVPGNVLPEDSSPQSQFTHHRLSLHDIATSPSLKRRLTSPYENGAAGYFPPVDPSTNGDAKVGAILEEGLKRECDAEGEVDPRKRQYYLSEALRIYNEGCNAKELYERITDVYGARIWLFDRSDWANVFFSAARVCTRFSKDPPKDRNGQTISPRQFKCNGSVLSAPDWDHQALHYLEQGRCRSLLHSISYGSTVTYKERWLLKKAVKYDMSVVVDAAMRSMRTATSHAPLPPTATSATLPEIITEIEKLRESPGSVLQDQTSRFPTSGYIGDISSVSNCRSKVRCSHLSNPAHYQARRCLRQKTRLLKEKINAQNEIKADFNRHRRRMNRGCPYKSPIRCSHLPAL